MKNILIVDDKTEVLKMVGRFPDKRCFAVYLSDSVDKALGLCNKVNFDLVLSDFDLGEGSGIDLLSEIKEAQPEVVPDGSLDALAALLHSRVRQTNKGYPGQTLPGIHLKFDTFGTLQTNHSVGVHACLHDTSLDWVVEIVNGMLAHELLFGEIDTI